MRGTGPAPTSVAQAITGDEGDIVAAEERGEKGRSHAELTYRWDEVADQYESLLPEARRRPVSPRRVVANTAIYQHGTSGSATATRAARRGAARTSTTSRCARCAPAAPAAPSSRAQRTGGRALGPVAGTARAAGGRPARVAVQHRPARAGPQAPARRPRRHGRSSTRTCSTGSSRRTSGCWCRAACAPPTGSSPSRSTRRESLRRMAPGTDVRVVTWAHPGGSDGPGAVPGPQGRAHGRRHRAGEEPGARDRGGRRAAGGHRRRPRAAGDRSGRPGRGGGARPRWPPPILAARGPRARPTCRPRSSTRRTRSSWLLLQPSYDEGFGLPLVEAAQHGLPVVHSGRGAMSRVLPEIDAHGVDAAALRRRDGAAARRAGLVGRRRRRCGPRGRVRPGRLPCGRRGCRRSTCCPRPRDRPPLLDLHDLGLTGRPATSRGPARMAAALLELDGPGSYDIAVTSAAPPEDLSPAAGS